MAPDFHTVTESQSARLALSTDEAAVLRQLGVELASTRGRWGMTSEPDTERSVIGVENIGPGQYRVLFRDVVGVLRLPSRQIHVVPKIPMAHFLYIAGHSEPASRSSPQTVYIDSSGGFIEILAGWFLDAAELLVRQGLRPDYASYRDELSAVRGRILPCESLLANLQGRPVADCEFDELSEDTALNRVVRAAAQRVSSLSCVSGTARCRARQVAYRMDGIGPMGHSDLRARPDSTWRSYVRVIPLAHLVLAGCGISAAVGPVVATSFLVRTPELVEDGIRAILSTALEATTVSKRKLFLGDSGVSVNPDLIFGDHVAIGDIKYRHLGRDWNRADLNQVVTFATAFRCAWALLLGFVSSDRAPLPRAVPVGEVSATCLAWIASADTTPAESAGRLASQVAEWYRACSRTPVAHER